MPARAEVERRRPPIQQSPEVSLSKDGYPSPDITTVLDLIEKYNKEASPFKDSYSAVNPRGLKAVVGQLLDGGLIKKELTEREGEVALSAARERPGQHWFSCWDVADGVNAVVMFRSGGEELPTPKKDRTQVSSPDCFSMRAAALRLKMPLSSLRWLMEKENFRPPKQGGKFVFSPKDIEQIRAIREERRLTKEKKEWNLSKRADAAADLGIGPKTLAGICRDLGILSKSLTKDQISQVNACLEQNKEKIEEAAMAPNWKRQADILGIPRYNFRRYCRRLEISPPGPLSRDELRRVIELRNKT